MNTTMIPLQEQERYGGANIKAVYTHADLTETTANTAQTLKAFDVADRDLVQLVMGILVTPFKDASDAAFNATTVTSGDGDDPDRLLASKELNANGTEVDAFGGTATVHVFTEDDTVDCTFAAMAAKSLSDLDSGEVHLFYKWVPTAKEAAN